MLKAEKTVFLISVAAVFVFSLAVVVDANRNHGFKTQDPQVAAGEWKIDVQVQPCESYKNLEVNIPKDPSQGGVVHIECNLMPVAAK